MSVLSFDELNALGKKRRSEPIEEYYDPMRISRKRRQKRIEVARKYRDALLDYMHFVDDYAEYGYIDEPATELLRSSIMELIEDAFVVIRSAEINAESVYRAYADRISKQIHDSTMRNKDKDEYFLSEDRATLIGEDESNALCGYDELQEAFEYGMSDKTWRTVGDKAVRDTHRAVDGKTVPIDSPFIVGGIEMMVPRDPEVDAPEETAGCRCWVTFS
ncbi:MAG: hypothetical protein IKO36_08290 [Bacteroidaceae bacterium]|nr:hypothetical protein [Bacteroidaceae bacterium]